MNGTEREKTNSWYTDAKKYWDSLEPTDSSMLGGLENLSDLDAAASGRFLSEFINNGMIKRQKYACDCGAGIGRVTRTFLLKFFEKVDMIEQTEKFLDQAEKDFEKLNLKDRVNFVPLGLQDFTPYPNKYDIIWCQWVLSHLRDDDLVSFLKRCIASAPFIGIKENYTEFKTIYDDEDSSKTRSESEWKALFDEAGLLIVRETKQIAFPQDLFPVKMFLLKKRSKAENVDDISMKENENPKNENIEIKNQIAASFLGLSNSTHSLSSASNGTIKKVVYSKSGVKRIVYLCIHEKRKEYCVNCGGSGLCFHGKQKSFCKVCGGSQICIHKKEKSKCKECKGSQVCRHANQKYQCKECADESGASQICIHKRQISFCRDCGGKGLCEHGTIKGRCRHCKGSQICALHGDLRIKCLECKKAADMLLSMTKSA